MNMGYFTSSNKTYRILGCKKYGTHLDECSETLRIKLVRETKGGKKYSTLEEVKRAQN